MLIDRLRSPLGWIIAILTLVSLGAGYLLVYLHATNAASDSIEFAFWIWVAAAILASAAGAAMLLLIGRPAILLPYILMLVVLFHTAFFSIVGIVWGGAPLIALALFPINYLVGWLVWRLMVHQLPGAPQQAKP
jgi:hypothetical protein